MALELWKWSYLAAGRLEPRRFFLIHTIFPFIENNRFNALLSQFPQKRILTIHFLCI